MPAQFYAAPMKIKDHNTQTYKNFSSVIFGGNAQQFVRGAVRDIVDDETIQNILENKINQKINQNTDILTVISNNLQEFEKGGLYPVSGQQIATITQNNSRFITVNYLPNEGTVWMPQPYQLVGVQYYYYKDNTENGEYVPIYYDGGQWASSYTFLTNEQILDIAQPQENLEVNNFFVKFHVCNKNKKTDNIQSQLQDFRYKFTRLQVIKNAIQDSISAIQDSISASQDSISNYISSFSNTTSTIDDYKYRYRRGNWIYNNNQLYYLASSLPFDENTDTYSLASDCLNSNQKLIDTIYEAMRAICFATGTRRKLGGIPMYDSSESYAEGDVIRGPVTTGNAIYKVIKPITQPEQGEGYLFSQTSECRRRITLSDLDDRIQTLNNHLQTIAPTYDSTSSYSINKIFWYNNQLRQVHTFLDAGANDSTIKNKTNIITIADVLYSLLSASSSTDSSQPDETQDTN